MESNIATARRIGRQFLLFASVVACVTFLAMAVNPSGARASVLTTGNGGNEHRCWTEHGGSLWLVNDQGDTTEYSTGDREKGRAAIASSRTPPCPRQSTPAVDFGGPITSTLSLTGVVLASAFAAVRVARRGRVTRDRRFAA